MRMWNVDPSIMCRKHLLGEHLELHMFMGCIKKGKSIDGYIKKGLVELDNIIPRHDELAKEMINRGYKHNSRMPPVVINPLYLRFHDNGYIENKKSLEELLSRCRECRERANL